MRYLALLCLAFAGCVTTRGTILYNPATGGKLAEFHSDMDLMTYNGGGVYCSIVNHRPSRTIAARGRAYSKVLGTAGEQAGRFGGLP